MKDIYKNPILYYIAVPIIVGLWPLLLWAIYLPNAQTDVEEQMDQYYDKAEPIMMEILTLDPDRLEFADPNETVIEFKYDRAIERVATLCDILPEKYRLNSRKKMTASGQTSQSASVRLQDIDITRFARFLSMIQLRWPSLHCNRVKLTKKKGSPNPDTWDVDIELKYYY